METICDFFDFKAAEGRPWFRVDGGMSLLPDALHNVVTQNGATVTVTAPVIAMQYNDNKIDVTFAPTSGIENKTYDYVFNTTTMGCLERMDLQGLNLDVEVLTAIRALAYDRDVIRVERSLALCGVGVHILFRSRSSWGCGV